MTVYFSCSSSALFSDEFPCVSTVGIIFCIVFPLLFTHIQSDHKHSSCIRTHIGLVLWILLFWTTGYSYCRSAGRLLHYYSHTKSTNYATVRMTRADANFLNCSIEYIYGGSLQSFSFSFSKKLCLVFLHSLVMIVSMVYLSLVHLHRIYFDYGSYTLDITGPLMVITQKVTLLTFSIHDGIARNENELTKSQQFHAIRTLPTALEFFSYVLHFQGLMAGPLVFYKDYIEFIEGKNFLKHTNGNVCTETR